MSNLPLGDLVWDWSYGDGGKTNAMCRAKSPSHEYIIRLEAGGDCYVDYRKFDNDEDSDNRKDEPPVFDSISAAQEWAQSTHYPHKMQPYILPEFISIDEQLPEQNTNVLVLYHAHFDDEPITEFDICTAFFHDEGFDVKDQNFYTKRKIKVVGWKAIDAVAAFKTMKKRVSKQGE